MTKSLTIVYVTSRKKSEFQWFLDSLALQLPAGQQVTVLKIDFFAEKRLHFETIFSNGSSIVLKVCNPKPSIWQGTHRITREDWWAASNSRNTGICLCQTEWIAFLDDRCVLMPGWLDSIERAMEGNYVLAGAYEKRTAMTVENGVIKNAGIVVGEDSREQWVKQYNATLPYRCPGQWLFGCTLALPLSFALQVNGYEELMDGLSMEDVIFGKQLEANNFPIFYDSRFKIVEDRTPSESGPVMRREDKGEKGTARDKSHAALDRFANKLRADNWGNDLTLVRNSVLNGGSFPIPDKNHEWLDWFDGSKINEL